MLEPRADIAAMRLWLLSQAITCGNRQRNHVCYNSVSVHTLTMTLEDTSSRSEQKTSSAPLRGFESQIDSQSDSAARQPAGSVY